MQLARAAEEEDGDLDEGGAGAAQSPAPRGGGGEDQDEDALENDGDDFEPEPGSPLASLRPLSSRTVVPAVAAEPPSASVNAPTPAPAPAPAAAASAAQAPVPSTSSGEAELLALEDLEKELGLGDLQLFAGGSGTSGGAAPSAVGSAPVEDDLDELEQYLQSISK